MIIVKIFQGPGNQMFQYAYGLAASKRVGTELKLDLSWFKDNSGHRQLYSIVLRSGAPDSSKPFVGNICSENAVSLGDLGKIL